MKLSTRARYALRMMLDVARHGGDGKPVSLTKIADRTAISRAYLEQLALALRAAHLLKGVAGRRGGYRLATPSSEITVGRVLEASIGPICLVDCLEDAELCRRAESCECRMVYQLINDRIADVLRSYTLEDLLNPGLALSGVADGARPAIDIEGLDGIGCSPCPENARDGETN